MGCLEAMDAAYKMQRAETTYVVNAVWGGWHVEVGEFTSLAGSCFPTLLIFNTRIFLQKSDLTKRLARNVMQLPRSSTRNIGCKFQYMSDLHLEVGHQYSTFDLSPTAPYLILAGDIGRLVDYDALLLFLSKQTAKFEAVFYVLGNHEFYGTSRSQGLELAAKLQSEPMLESKLHLLNRSSYNIPNSQITILGCTLQSHIPASAIAEIEFKIQDFKQIRDWSVQQHNAEHVLDYEYLRDTAKSMAVLEPERRLLIITHHAPIVSGTSKLKDVGSSLTPAFATDVLPMSRQSGGDWCFRNVRVWIFGHTHFTNEFGFGGMRVVANQRGYVLNGHKLEGGQAAKEGFWRKLVGKDGTRHEFDAVRTITI